MTQYQRLTQRDCFSAEKGVRPFYLCHSFLTVKDEEVGYRGTLGKKGFTAELSSSQDWQQVHLRKSKQQFPKHTALLFSYNGNKIDSSWEDRRTMRTWTVSLAEQLCDPRQVTTNISALVSLSLKKV